MFLECSEQWLVHLAVFDGRLLINALAGRIVPSSGWDSEPRVITTTGATLRLYRFARPDAKPSAGSRESPYGSGSLTFGRREIYS